MSSNQLYNIIIGGIKWVQNKFIKALDIRNGPDYTDYEHSTARQKSICSRVVGLYI